MQGLFVGHFAAALHLAAVDDVHHLGGLRAAHHRRARRGPGKNKARIKPAPAHAVVARAKRAAQHKGELGHPGVGHGLDHFGAVFDGPGALGHRAHHIAGGVLQKDQGRAALVAQLDELRRLGRTCGLDRAVVAQNAHQLTVHAGVAAQHLGGVTGFELQKVRGVHQPRDNFAHVVGLALVGGDYAQEFLLVKQRFVPRSGSGSGDGHRVPAQLVEHLARHGDGVGVVLAQVFAQAGYVGVGLSPAQLVFGAVFAHRSLDQGRAGQKDVRAPTHQDHIVRQAGQIRPTRRRRAVHHRYLRQPGGRHARLVGKAAPAFDKYFGLVEQIGAAAFHQVDHGQLVFQGDLLGAQRFAQAHGRHCAAFNCAVVHRHQAALAGHHANTHN